MRNRDLNTDLSAQQSLLFKNSEWCSVVHTYEFNISLLYLIREEISKERNDFKYQNKFKFAEVFAF